MEEKVNILWFWQIHAPFIGFAVMVLIVGVVSLLKWVKPEWVDKIEKMLTKQF